MSRVLATTVLHGRQIGQEHGAAYVANLERRSVHRVIEFRDGGIDWHGVEGGRGLRGIAVYRDSVFIAASNRLIEYDLAFEPRQSWRCDALMDARGLAVHEQTLFVVSAGNDCVLGFDLEQRAFRWAMHVASDIHRFKAVTFAPDSGDAPLAINKLNLRGISADEAGLRLHGLKTGGLLYFNGKTITMSVELPAGSNDARLFRNGVLFNDSRAGALRYAARQGDEENHVMPVPFFDPTQHQELDTDEARACRRGYARGLCVLGDNVAVTGVTPAGLMLFDIDRAERLGTVTFTRDTDESVNCLAVLPETD